MSFYVGEKGNTLTIERSAATQPTTTPTTEAARCKGTIFLLHGIGDYQQLGPYVLYRETLTHCGYRCVQIDLRGHGRSTGDWITYGVRESQDLVQVLDQLEQRSLIEGDVGIIGVSYGGSVAIKWASIDPRIKAVVALEPFASLRDAAIDAAPVVLGSARIWFSREDLLKAVDKAGKLADFNPDDTDIVAAIRKASQPILMFHSKSDQLISERQSERLHDAAPDHSRLILFEKDSHFDMGLREFDAINNAALPWLDRYVAHELPTTRE
jgi:pimeloyl-ACP methyl ester carboxylesterase